MSRPHKHFFWVVMAGFAATLLPIVALNLFLISNSLDSRDNIVRASNWQQATHGIVNAPSDLDDYQFKLLRLRDKLPKINTVVFGASTTFGIDQSMFPASLHIYNFASNGANVTLGLMIGEAEYVMAHADNIKWLVIPLDWAVGHIYRDEKPPEFNLFVNQPQAGHQQVTLLQKIRESLSYPRVAMLYQLLKSIFRAEDKYAAFRQIFLQPASDEYICKDGTRAKDFNLQHRGICRGFRADGSWTYSDSVGVSDARRLILLATAPDSKSAQNLLETHGIPNPLYLRRLAALAHQAAQRGGGVIFIMPPLLSGMEAEFMRDPQWSAYLARTKQSLSDWAKQENLMFIDAGQSEKFGCTPKDFADAYHPKQGCYRKIFSAFWRNHDRFSGVQSLSRN